MEELKLTIFCTKCQEETTHIGHTDDNGEFVFECLNKMDEVDGRDVPHHFVKFPADTNPDEFVTLLEKHMKHNEGQISVAKQNQKLKDLVNAVTLQNASASEGSFGSNEEIVADPVAPSTTPDSTSVDNTPENQATDNSVPSDATTVLETKPTQ